MAKVKDWKDKKLISEGMSLRAFANRNWRMSSLNAEWDRIRGVHPILSWWVRPRTCLTKEPIMEFLGERI
jgi:hypothetical protein